MGWSCRKEAGDVVQAWTEACVAQTDSQNTFVPNGDVKYFWETSHREYGDGAITGTIWKFLPNGFCRRSGTFRIEGDGTITRAPKWLKDAAIRHKVKPRPMFEVV
jgi:hypothetical protein